MKSDESAQRRVDAMTEAIAQRNNAAAERDLEEAGKAAYGLRRDAIAGGSAKGLLVGLLLWPFLHMKQH